MYNSKKSCTFAAKMISRKAMGYKASDRMCDLMGSSGNGYCREGEVLQLLNRFGIRMGVGDKTIAEVCEEQGVDCDTLLTVVNYARTRRLEAHTSVDVDTLQRYLENAHTYFLDFQLPRIRRELLSAINLAKGDTRIPLMIIKYFDEYMDEIRAHIEHEKSYSYEQHARDDQYVALKAHELKSLIVKYYPNNNQGSNSEPMQMLYTVLHDLHHFEQELALHCSVEDYIMLPALEGRKTEIEVQESSSVVASNHQIATEKVLSARELEIVKQIALGLSNKEIADKLYLSTHTVMSHRKNIARKLDIHSTAGLTIYAVVNGIVEVGV